VPSVWNLVRFVVPASMVGLINMIMCSIDTASVARYGGTVQLGSLAPATAGTEYVCYLLSFLQTATLTLMAQAGEDEEKRGNYLGLAFVLAFCVGITQSFCTWVWAPNIVRFLGEGTPEMAAHAVSYMRIRSWSACFYYLTNVCLAARFSVRDSVSPMMLGLLIGLINFSGNMYLCPRLSTAVIGAAWATVGAQAIGTVIAFSWITLRGQLPRKLPWKYLNWKRFMQFASFMPLSGIVFTRLAVYSFCGRMCCSLGTVGAACHQVGVNLWWISGFPGEAAEQATLAYLPRLLLLPADPGKYEGTQRVCRAARQTMRRVLGVAVVYALILVLIMEHFTQGSRLGWLTKDVAVLAQMPTEIISLASLFVAPTLVLEGTLFAFNRKSSCFFIIVMTALIACSTMVGLERHIGLANCVPRTFWFCILWFVSLRFLGNAVTILWTMRQRKLRPAE